MIPNVAVLHVANAYIAVKYIVQFIARLAILANPFMPIRLLPALSCFMFCSTSKQFCCYLSISTKKFCNFYDDVINCLLY